jgi:hypothetical protein
MPGDLDPSCIGVYKIPMDSTMPSEEQLKASAPDVQYVPPATGPSTNKDALDTLQAQRKAADDIQTVVLAGRLEEAGIKVLKLIPKVTLAGQRIVDSLSTDTVVAGLRQQQYLTLFQTADVAWKNVDVTIGQGLRGQLGVSAVAQLLIVSEIKEATAALDDFLYAVQKL